MEYTLERLQIKEATVIAKSKQEYHPIAVKSKNTEDQVEGMVFELTSEELQQADR